MKSVLILGATSAIAQAVARLLAGEGTRLFLVARSPGALEAVRADLAARGAEIGGTFLADLADPASHAAAIAAADATLQGLDAVLVAYGSLPDQAACEASPQATIEAIGTNFTSYAALLTLLAQKLEDRRRGTLVVLTSVAGDRGRRSNYVYGSAKGATSIFLEGLEHRLAASGVAVVNIKPGMIDTPMTAAFRKGPLWSTPARIAPAIVRCLRSERGGVRYVPWYWRPIMAVIRAIPRNVFGKMKL